MFYVAYGISNLSQVVGAALDLDDEESIRRVSTRIHACRRQLESWADRAGARHVADLGTAGIFEVEPEHDEAMGLADIVDQLSEYLGGLQLSFGVGMTCNEAWQALRRAAEAGEPYCLYDPGAPEPGQEADSDLDARLALNKAESPVAGADATTGPDPSDVKQKIRAALQGIKAQAPILETLKEQAPEAYAAIQAVIMAMVAMAQELAHPDVQKGEAHFKRLGLPMPKKTPVGVRFPAAEANPGSAAGATNLTDEKKSIPTDPLTGLPIKTKWHSVRSGQVVGTKGGIVPSREPQQE